MSDSQNVRFTDAAATDFVMDVISIGIFIRLEFWMATNFEVNNPKK